MSAVKITTFFGLFPKVSPELLPEMAGQVSNNTKLVSGDLVPFPSPVIVDNAGITGEIKTLYAFKGDQGENRWLAWNTDVDVAIVTATGSTDRRFYYTGDGPPKVSNFSMAFAGSGPYPAGFYELGLPLPTTKPTVTVTQFVPVVTSSYARDTNNIATLVTATPHTLRPNAIITVTGFSYLGGSYSLSPSSPSGPTTIICSIPGHGLTGSPQVTLEFPTGDAPSGTYVATVSNLDEFSVALPAEATEDGTVRLSLLGFNVTGVTATIINSTTIQYFSPGPALATTSSAVGTIDLGSPTGPRSYVYTWVTPWGEESIASEPTETVYVREGVTITVSNLPTAKPTGNNFVRGIRLYRTLSTVQGSEYFRLRTLWFPTGVASVRREDDVATLMLVQPHNLGVGNRFKISGCVDTSFNITGGIVIDIPDEYTFTYASVGSDTPLTAVTAGTLFHDVSENPPTTTARYWGDGGNYDFIDDFDALNLSVDLGSDNFDPPPANLQGLTAVQNNILAAFVGNKMYLTPPNTPHAWPEEFAVTFQHNIIGLAPINGSILVLTDAYPFLVSGSDPAAGMSVQRVDALYPCLNGKGIVSMNYGVVYPTHDGLAVYSPASGPTLITRANFDNDAWDAQLDPTTIVADFFGDTYIASHSTGGFIFEPVPQAGGQFVTIDFDFTASYYDSVEGRLFGASGINGDIYEWDSPAQATLTQDWKSKVIKTPRMLNLGAARVIADYGAPSALWEDANKNWEAETMLWSALDNITFRMWVDKELIFTTTLNDSGVFRLPAGYLSDTFEVGVEGDIRVRAIHLGETPLSLKEA
jgi:hypothetical protein